jgi:hypothetical protein
MRDPWQYETGAHAKIAVSVGTNHATISVAPPSFPAMPAATLSLVEIEELRGALGRAAAHLRAERAKPHHSAPAPT